MTPEEKRQLKASKTLIESKVAAAKQTTGEALAQQITVSYFLGAENGLKETKSTLKVSNVGTQGLDAVINDFGPRLDDTFGILEKDLTNIITDGISNNESFEKISADLQEKMKTWGDEIPFENAGKTVDVVKVNPDGSTSIEKHTITRNVTLPVDVYADTLSRTATKEAYAAGHIQAYKDSGLEKWQYSSVADERTRERHIALHGKVLKIGSADSDMAFSVMSEHNCRCRPVPFFDDEELDAPPDEFAEEKEAWAKDAIEETPNAEKKAFLDEVVNDRQLKQTQDNLPFIRNDIRQERARLNTITNSNAKIRDTARHDFDTNLKGAYQKYNGASLPDSFDEQVRIREAFTTQAKIGARYLSDDELKYMGQFAIDKDVASKIAREKRRSNSLNIATASHDTDVEFLIKFDRMNRGGYTPTVKKLDARIIGRGTEEYYIHDRNGKVLRYVSNPEHGDNFLPKSFRAPDGVVTFNAVDEVTFIPVRYAVNAANAGATELRMVVPVHKRGDIGVFPSYNNAPTVYRIRTNGLTGDEIATAYERAFTDRLKRDLLTDIDRRAWAQAARDAGFRYDEILMDVTEKQIDSLHAAPLKKLRTDIKERYSKSIGE